MILSGEVKRLLVLADCADPGALNVNVCFLTWPCQSHLQRPRRDISQAKVFVVEQVLLRAIHLASQNLLGQVKLLTRRATLALAVHVALALAAAVTVANRHRALKHKI